MARLRDVPNRSEIEGKIEKADKDMDEKGEMLDKIATDLETIRHTLVNLDLGGTREGADELEASFENTDRTTTEIFHEKDGELERVQEENKEHEREIEERRNSSESDLGKISEATAKISTNESISELLKAKEAGLQEIDFLKNQIERAREAMSRSEAIQEQLKGRIHADQRR
jgi:chromosome segregation ATPase